MLLFFGALPRLRIIYFLNLFYWPFFLMAKASLWDLNSPARN